MSDTKGLERHADEVDRASDLARIATEEGIKKVLSRIEKAPADFDGSNCYDCDNEIPKGRLNTGAFRCIECQTKLEHDHKNHRSYYE